MGLNVSILLMMLLDGISLKDLDEDCDSDRAEASHQKLN
jgi:hypothetical protein